MIISNIQQKRLDRPKSLYSTRKSRPALCSLLLQALVLLSLSTKCEAAFTERLRTGTEGRLSKLLNKQTARHQDKIDQEKLKQRSQLSPLDLLPSVEEMTPAEKLPIVGASVVGFGWFDEDTQTYYRDVPPFTATDEYNFMDAFFSGLKLDDFFEYSDECINAFVWLVDDSQYLQNNITHVERNATENDWNIWLNVTYMIGGKGSEIIPQCYLFGNSLYVREAARWERFQKDWGEFFLALLFNMMGNALNFQQRITNIKVNEENQDFVGVYREYGYIIHLVYDFEPLPTAAISDTKKYVSQFVNDVAPYLSPLQKIAVEQGVTTLANLIMEHTNAFMDSIVTFVQAQPFYDHVYRFYKKAFRGKKIKEPVSPAHLKPVTWQQKQTYTLKNDTQLEKTNMPVVPLRKIENVTSQKNFTAPKVGIFDYEFNGFEDFTFILYGFANGMIEPFPTESLPQFCRSNITQSYWSFNRIFIDFQYNLSEDDEFKSFMYAIQDLLQFPYFVSFNCYYSIAQVYFAKDPWADGVLTMEEKLRVSIIIVDDVLTNLIFNIGYMYTDIENFVTIASTTPDYWKTIGSYLGDFFIRIFWRQDFLTNFVY